MIRTEEEEQPTNIKIKKHNTTTKQHNNKTTKTFGTRLLNYKTFADTSYTSDFVFNMKNTFSIFIYHFAVYYSYHKNLRVLNTFNSFKPW